MLSDHVSYTSVTSDQNVDKVKIHRNRKKNHRWSAVRTVWTQLVKPDVQRTCDTNQPMTAVTRETVSCDTFEDFWKHFLTGHDVRVWNLANQEGGPSEPSRGEFSTRVLTFALIRTLSLISTTAPTRAAWRHFLFQCALVATLSQFIRAADWPTGKVFPASPIRSKEEVYKN